MSTSSIPQRRRRLVSRVLSEGKPYRIHLVGVLALGLLSIPLVLLAPIPIAIAIDSGLNGAPLPGPLRHFPMESGSSFDVLVVAGVMQVVIVLLYQLQAMVAGVLSSYTGEKLTLEFRARLFRHFQRLSIVYHDAQGTSDAVYRVQYDATSIKEILVDGLIPFMSAALTVVGMVYITVRVNPELAVVASVIVPFLYLAARRYRRWTRSHYRAAKGLESSSLGVVQEVLSNLRVVKAFTREEGEHARFIDRASAGLHARMRLTVFESLFSLVVNLIVAVGTATVLVVGIQQVRAGALSLGALLVVLAYMAQLFAPLKTISKKVADLQNSFAGAERAYEVLDLQPEVSESTTPRTIQRRVAGEIVFENVTFGYGNGEPVLRDVSCRIPSGTRLALLGRTGEGKTTIAGLLARFFDPTAGRILLDGVDLREYAIRDLRDQFAFVLQDPVLFSTSLAENIAYAKPDASQRAIVAAAKAAGAHGFIKELPKGYDTPVGERGMRLSGGERQRISLARAFLKDAPVLVLDEPTSALDIATEATIMQAVERLMRDRTSILITHRPSVAGAADASIELAHGRIARSTGVPRPRRGASRRTGVQAHQPRHGRVSRSPGKEPSASAVWAWSVVDPKASAPTAVDVVLTPRGRSPWKSSVFRLRGAGPGGSAVVAKRTERAAAQLERRIYEEVLATLKLGTPRYYGYLEDGDAGWLFLEDVAGELYRETDRRDRGLAACWLADLHTLTAGMSQLADLPDRGPVRYLGELRSARTLLRRSLAHRTFGPEGNACLCGILDLLDAVEEDWEVLERTCDGVPSCLVHADFTAKNVLVGGLRGAPVLRVMDWGSCGWGPPAPDLPAVTLPRYRADIERTWPDLDRSSLARLARAGAIFRLLVWIEREARGLEGVPSHRTMRKLAWYEADLRRLAPMVETAP